MNEKEKLCSECGERPAIYKGRCEKCLTDLELEAFAAENYRDLEQMQRQMQGPDCSG